MFFSSSEFKNATKEVVLLKFDATKDSDLLAQLKKKFQIKGLPTILFFDSKGQWLEKLTLTEFEKKELFLKRLQSLK
jgi:thiol:disulfide interchange protein DsbD